MEVFMLKYFSFFIYLPGSIDSFWFILIFFLVLDFPFFILMVSLSQEFVLFVGLLKMLKLTK